MAQRLGCKKENEAEACGLSPTRGQFLPRRSTVKLATVSRRNDDPCRPPRDANILAADVSYR